VQLLIFFRNALLQGPSPFYCIFRGREGKEKGKKDMKGRQGRTGKGKGVGRKKGGKG